MLELCIDVGATDEPDLSNPTRPRWERPLDTIRSFEKAIDGGYTRRSVSRSGTTPRSRYDVSECANTQSREL